MVRFLIQDFQSIYHEISLPSLSDETLIDELYSEVSRQVCIDSRAYQLKSTSSGSWLPPAVVEEDVYLLEALQELDDAFGGYDCSNKLIMLEMTVPIDGGIDFQHREGGKTGSGGQLSESQAALERKERLRRLALETIDISKDPYIMKNHLGTYECKLCLTLHPNEGNYLAHTQGKRHQYNLGRRAAMEAKTQARSMAPLVNLIDKKDGKDAENSKKRALKIGRPGYKVTKSRDLMTRQRSLLFEIDYPEVSSDVQPRHRFMSAFEQKVDIPDKNFQYLLFACEPYETIAFKIPNDPIDKREGRFFTHWDANSKHFALQLYFVDGAANVPKPPPPPLPTSSSSAMNVD